MAGDLSRRTFDPRKRYSGVQAQQGRVLTDADLNEQLEIGLHRTEVEAVDTIGRCGVPKTDGGFAISTTPDGRDLAISSGRLYAEGLLCELYATRVALFFPTGTGNFEAIVTHLVVDDRPFETGQWVEISADGTSPAASNTIRIMAVDSVDRRLTFDTDIMTFRSLANPTIRRVTTYATQPDDPAPDFIAPSTSPPGGSGIAVADGRYLVYVKAWQREVDAIDDPHIREIALGGPDTATRLKNVWQVHFVKLNATSPPIDCASPIPEWAVITAKPTGRMTARATAEDPTSKPCVLPPTSGFRRLENQLYRVQIHLGGDRDHATFKWSREAGSVRTRVKIFGNTIIADDLGKDAVLGFSGGDWVEIVDEVSTLKESLNEIVLINPPDPATREITTSAFISGLANQPGLAIQRWNQSGPTATKDGVRMQGSWMDLEDGVQVRFSPGTYRTGDYWLIPARTSSGDVEWPPFETPNTNPSPESPVGIARHYCRLAIATIVGNKVTGVEDCRALFPPLTAITASDVGYDPAGCPDLAGASTVKDALDALCRAGRGACTIVAAPGDSLQELFDRIPPGADAEVCFQVGAFTLTKTIVIQNKGRLKITGGGLGTRLSIASETAIRFENCAGVLVRDLYAESVVASGGGNLQDLNGTLTFQNCPDVDVEDVGLSCGGGAVRAGTCLTVRNAPDSNGPIRTPSARIADCRVEVGNLQVGILLVNVARAEVRGNTLGVVGGAALSLGSLINDFRFRATLRKRLIAGAVMGTKPPSGGVTNAKVLFGTHTILFQTPPSLKQEWQNIITARPPKAGATAPQVLEHMNQLADKLLLDPRVRAISPKFNDWFSQLAKNNEPIAFQGIVVAGSIARDVRVSDNTIEGFLQGVHVGVSHRVNLSDAPATKIDVAGSVSITGNTALIVVSQDSIRRERHGIFVGNSSTISIAENVVRLRRVAGADNVTIEGAKIHGHLGPRAIVRDNHLVGFPTGLTVTPRFPYPNAATVLWLVADNLFEHVQTQVNLPKPPHGGAPVVVQGNKGSA